MFMETLLSGYGTPDTHLSEQEIRDILSITFLQQDIKNKKVLLIIPDSTRTMPMPLFFRIFYDLLHKQVKKLGVLVALGTHQPMSETALLDHLGITAAEQINDFSDVSIYNHEWQNKDTFIEIGKFNRQETRELSQGLLDIEVPIRVNRLVKEYDLLIVCGPVFPHEVAGFSGGSKYFFPGISGPEVINFTHWLGALATTQNTIGIRNTPVRTAIERAAAAITTQKLYCCPVVKQEGIFGLFFGDPLPAWEAAASLSAQVHVKYYQQSFQKAISIIPEMYDDLWTGAKGMYKIDPVIADNGELILYAPHITEVSYTHGKLIDEIGYHVLDYFTAQWDQYKNYPWGVLAHSTHLRGRGTYINNIEKPRIQIALATGIPPERCQKIGLKYVDPDSIQINDWQNREDEGILYVPHAGETLLRLKIETKVT